MNIYEGQQYDMDFETRLDVSVEEYMEMIRLKTSVLLGCACGMGALMAGADFESQLTFFNYGVNLGLAFQLQDDYLDTYGNPETFGKAIGGDILNDKKTWLLIMALNEDKTGTVKALIGDNSNPQEKSRKSARSMTPSAFPTESMSLSAPISTRPSPASTSSESCPRHAPSSSTSRSNRLHATSKQLCSQTLIHISISTILPGKDRDSQPCA